MSEITLTGWDVLDEARAMLRAAVAGVPASGWQRPTPCAQWNVTQVLQHAALDQRVWGAALAGTNMPGENPFAPSGQLGAEPLAYAEGAQQSGVGIAGGLSSSRAHRLTAAELGMWVRVTRINVRENSSELTFGIRASRNMRT